MLHQKTANLQNAALYRIFELYDYSGRAKLIQAFFLNQSGTCDFYGSDLSHFYELVNGLSTHPQILRRRTNS